MSFELSGVIGVKCGLGKHTKDVPKDGPSCFPRVG